MSTKSEEIGDVNIVQMGSNSIKIQIHHCLAARSTINQPRKFQDHRACQKADLGYRHNEQFPMDLPAA